MKFLRRECKWMEISRFIKRPKKSWKVSETTTVKNALHLYLCEFRVKGLFSFVSLCQFINCYKNLKIILPDVWDKWFGMYILLFTNIFFPPLGWVIFFCCIIVRVSVFGDQVLSVLRGSGDGFEEISFKSVSVITIG